VERMLDGVSLDQLRTFIAAVDEGSFSAASRKLLRAQSVVSGRSAVWNSKLVWCCSIGPVVTPSSHLLARCFWLTRATL